MEFVEAAGVVVVVDGLPLEFRDMTFEKTTRPADLVGMADGLADTMVICAGGLSICGIADKPLLKEVDDNNLLKIHTGHFDESTGKFIKAKNHPKPDIAGVLKSQGWVDEEVCVSH